MRACVCVLIKWNGLGGMERGRRTDGESSHAQKRIVESIQVGVLYIYSLIGLSSYQECGMELIRPLYVIIIDFLLTFHVHWTQRTIGHGSGYRNNIDAPSNCLILFFLCLLSTQLFLVRMYRKGNGFSCARDDPFLLLMSILRSLITHYNIITIYCRFTVSGPILACKRDRLQR